MTQVYNQTGANDTPVLVPGWTVQSSTSGANGGENQSLTGHAGPQGGLVQPQTAPAHTTDTTTFSSATSTTLNNLIDKLKTAGVLV